jgi:DNA-binding CsgD family transcriptional regulator
MGAPGHAGANLGLQAKVTTRHRANAQLNGAVTRSLEVLIRELVAQAGNGVDCSGKENNNGNGQVIIDAEVDGVRCVLTRLQTAPTSRVSFSPREREIARMVAEGYPNKAIAAVLEISSWTVCTHLRRIFAKLRVSSRAAMVARMMDIGILSRDRR